MGSIDKWVDFFHKAGLQKDAANTYAHSFTENRIQMTMLTDLNKEYLKEMGIYRTGDIILILKQAKFVQEQRRLAAVVEAKSVKRSFDDENDDDYKPSPKRQLSSVADKGSDSRIVERRVISQRNKEEDLPPITKKIVAPVLQRTSSVLKNARDSDETSPRVSIATRPVLSKSNSGSIFDRLGSKSVDPQMSSKILSPLTTKQKTTQRVLLVKKVPAKAVYASESSSEELNSEDDYTNMSSGTKAVKFALQDETIEIKGAKRAHFRNKLKQGSNISVKARLGLKSPIKTTSQALAKMRLQASPQNQRAIGTLKSDEMVQRKNKPIHDRLFAKDIRSPVRSPIKKQNINMNRKVIRVSTKNGNQSGLKKQGNVKQSVFDRLGNSNGRNK